MRADLAPILLHLLILVAGLGLLRIGGVVPHLWSMRSLAAGGLAYMCGLGAALTLSILLLVIGGPFNLATFVVICLVLTAPLIVDLPAFGGAVRTRPLWLIDPKRYWREASLEKRLVLVTMAAFALIALIGIFTLSGQALGKEDYDAWNLWMRKANLLFFGSHLPVAVFKSHAEGYIQAYYPLGFPLLLAAHMRAIGAYETSVVHVVEWVLLVAFVWAGAFLASRVTRPAVWAALLPGVVFLVYGQASTGYADVPVALFLCLAVLATGIWLERRRRSDLWVACLLLAGATQIKNEGFIGALIVLAVACCYLLAERRTSAIRELAIGAAGVVLVAILPWRLWLVAKHIPSDHSLGETFNPVYLIDHFNRVWPSLKALENQITIQTSASIFIVIALALALLRLRGRTSHPLSGFYLAVGLLYFLSLLAAYWTSPFGDSGLPFYIQTTIFRIVPGGLAFICIAAIVHLSSAEPEDAPVLPAAERAAADTPVAAPIASAAVAPATTTAASPAPTAASPASGATSPAPGDSF